MMDKVREALEAAQTDLEITQHTFGGLTVAQHERVLSAVKQALTALQGAGEVVAWRSRIVPSIAPRWIYSEEKPTWPDAEIQTAFDKNGVRFEAQPLYTTPPSPAAIRRERERCARVVEQSKYVRTAGQRYLLAEELRSLPNQPPAGAVLSISRILSAALSQPKGGEG